MSDNDNDLGDVLMEEEQPLMPDKDEVLQSISLKPDSEIEDSETQENIESEIEIEEPKIEKPKKVIVEVDKETQELYDDFSSFLEQKADIKPSKEIREVIPTGIRILDAYLGGGFAIGALNIITGTPGSGKSMLSAQTLGNAQKIYKGQKFIAGFMDSEESTSKLRLSQLGVNNPAINPIGNLTVEKVFKFLDGMCLYKEKNNIIDVPSIAIWDSIANTLSEKEQEATDINQVIGYKARMLSILVPRSVARAAQHNICWLAVNQLRDSLQMGQFAPAADLKFMSSSKIMPGGQVLRFNAFQLLEMGVKSALKSDDGTNQKYGIDGIIAKVKIVKNKLFVPNITVEILGSFVRGFSDFWTCYYHLANSGRLKTGGWNSLINAPKIKFRTKDAEARYLSEDKLRQAFDEAVEDLIKVDIIDKYTMD